MRPSVVRLHSGNGLHEDMDRRAIVCFDHALADICLADAEVGRVLYDYFAWATTATMSRYHRSADDVPDGLRIPRWSWTDSSVGDLHKAPPRVFFECSLSATRRLLLQGCAVDQQQFVNFVRQRGLAVIATRGADGAPQAALVGIAATGRGELVFDTRRSSRKYRNLSAFAHVALVIGWDNEMTVQCEGTADIPTGADRDRCLQAYLAQYPDGIERVHDHDIVHVRVCPSWLRYSDYRPGSFTVEETTLGH